MPRRNPDGLVAQLRGDAAQEALREALLVPWSRLQQAAEAYVEWLTFLLWVRAIMEAAEDVPESLRSALDHRCPGFLDSERPSRRRWDWRALEEWVAEHRFAEAKAGGWFTALTYYAYKDLRTEQAWTLWERSTAAWSRRQPVRWPTFDEWAAAIDATHTLSGAGTEKAHAVEAMANVEPNQLRRAVSDSLESRAFAIWVGCVSRPQAQLTESVMCELRRRCPNLVEAAHLAPKWDMPFLFRLVRFGDAHWCATAREQGWIPALRFQVRHHPRYQRLIHYRERCRDLWSQSLPISYPPFTEWLAAADAYCVRPAA
jgi:hypothetical protein